MQLQKTFSYIISSSILKDISLDVGEVIAKKGLKASRKDCLDILNIYGIESLEDFKDKSIKLTLFYIVAALKDNLITEEEIKEIVELKNNIVNHMEKRTFENKLDLKFIKENFSQRKE